MRRVCLTTLCAALWLYSGGVRADTPSGSPIYLYDSYGNPVNVSSLYVYNYQDPHVYDLSGNPIGTVVIGGYIDNDYGQHIGYIGGL